MKCQEIKAELTSYLGDELQEYKKQAVLEHIQNCSSCALEMLRLQRTVEDLRNEFAIREDAPVGSLSTWVKKQAAELSDTDIRDRKQFVASIGSYEPSEKETSDRRSTFAFRQYKTIAAVIVLAVVLFTFWPQAVRASVQLPFVGEWIRQLVLQDAGLKWAYEHGYMSESPVSVAQHGVKLTVLGWVADPVQTTVIYLIEGLETDEGAHVVIPEIDGEGAFSWYNSAQKTPLGYVGLTHTKAVALGEHELTVKLQSPGKTYGDLELRIPVTREAISRLSVTKDLVYEKTVNGVTLKAECVIYTPTQIRIDYTVIGGRTVTGMLRPEEEIYLKTSDGQKIPSRSGHGTIYDDRAEYYQVFERPKNSTDLVMVVPMLSRYESVFLTFAVDDAGSLFTVADNPVILQEWQMRSDAINLKFIFSTDSLLKGLGKWLVQGQEANANTVTYSGPDDDGNVMIGYSLPYHGPAVPTVAATEAQILIHGNWEIPLESDK